MMTLKDLVVNESPDSSTRKILDLILELLREDRVFTQEILSSEGLDQIKLKKYYNILFNDGLIAEDNVGPGYVLTPLSYKFEGYMKDYNKKFWRRIFLALWNLIVSILVPFAVAYFTVKFTIQPCP